MIDREIQELVFVLKKIGIETIASCEGHLGSDFHTNFPWVAFYPNNLDFLKDIIKEYNENKLSEERWEVSFSRVLKEKPVYLLKPKHDYKDIHYLQEQSFNLKNYLKEIPPRSYF